MRVVSHNFSSFEALQSVLETQKIAQENSVLVQMFFPPKMEKQAREISGYLFEKLPHAQLIAASSAGNVAEGAMVDGTITLSFSLFASSSVRVVVGTSLSHEENMAILRGAIGEESKLVVLFADTFAYDVTPLLEAMACEYPRIVLAGGNGADAMEFRAASVFSFGQQKAAFVAAIVDSKTLRIGTKHLLNWQTIGKEMPITKSSGATLYELEGMPIKEVYKKYLGEEIAENILEYATVFPLLFKREGLSIARAPLSVNEDGSITYAGNFEGAKSVLFGYADVHRVYEDAKEQIRDLHALAHEAIYVYTCAARRSMLGRYLDLELAALSRIAPLSGFVTYGEFYHDQKNATNSLLNITTVYITLDETESKSTEVSLERTPSPQTKEQVVLKALTRLVRTTGEELDANIHYLRQFQSAVNEASIFSITDTKGIIKEVNDNFCTISGYTREELIGRPHNIVRHGDMPKEAFREMWETIAQGRIWKGLVKNRRKDTTPYYVLSEIAPIYDKDGNLKEYIGIRNDVTELESYKEFLKKNLDLASKDLHYLKQYESAINDTTAVVKTDLDNKIIHINKHFSALSGFSIEDLYGVDCSFLRDYKHVENGDCEKVLKQLKKGIKTRKVLTNIAKDGGKYIVDTYFYPIYDEEGNIVELIQAMHDVSEIYKLNEEIVLTQKEVVYTMGAIGESRSRETGLHVKRVAEYSYLLAKLYGLDEAHAYLIKQASPMHDIGKVAIPDHILNKPGKLTPEEFEIMKTHAQLGYEMLGHSERPILKTSAVIAHTHHEKYNGKGYPRGLAGDAIPIEGRITSIADVFDALAHDRVYKKAWPLEDILKLLREERGVSFDPVLIDLFFENLEDFVAIQKRLAD